MLKKYMSIFCIFLLLFSLVPIKIYAISPTEMGEIEKYVYYLEQEFGCKDNSNIKYIKDLVETSPELVTVGSVAKTVVCSHPYVALAIAGVTVVSGIYYYNKDSINSYVNSIYTRLVDSGEKISDNGVLTGKQIEKIGELISYDKVSGVYKNQLSEGHYRVSFPYEHTDNKYVIFVLPPDSTLISSGENNHYSEYGGDVTYLNFYYFNSKFERDGFYFCHPYNPSDTICSYDYELHSACSKEISINKEQGGISFKNYNSSPFKNVQPKKTYNFVPNKEKVPSLDNFVGLEVQPKTSTEPGTSTDPGASTDSSTSTDSKNLEIPDKVELDFSPLKLNLKDKFPFCVPYDLINLVRSFISQERKIPEFSVTFPAILGTKAATIKLSFKDFVHVAQLLRYFILIAFVCGLIKITRDMIRG